MTPTRLGGTVICVITVAANATRCNPLQEATAAMTQIGLAMTQIPNV